MILLATIKHTGTNYCFSVLNRERTRLTRDGLIEHDADILWSHFDIRTPYVLELSKRMKTVIPLRHPARIAISWRKRGQTGWLKEWMRMGEVEDAFYFPLETKPFDELEEFTGFTLNRHDEVINSIGDYRERDLVSMGRYLGDEWGDVFTALETPVGRKIYGTDLRWL